MVEFRSHRKGTRKMVEAMIESVPICLIHKIKMTPVSWYRSNGKTTETDYACEKCIKERKQGEAVYLSPGPIISY